MKLLLILFISINLWSFELCRDSVHIGGNKPFWTNKVKPNSENLFINGNCRAKVFDNKLVWFSKSVNIIGWSPPFDSFSGASFSKSLVFLESKNISIEPLTFNNFDNLHSYMISNKMNISKVEVYYVGADLSKITFKYNSLSKNNFKMTVEHGYRD